MDFAQRRFYARLGVMRCTRDLVVFGATLILGAARWLDEHPLRLH